MKIIYLFCAAVFFSLSIMMDKPISEARAAHEGSIRSLADSETLNTSDRQAVDEAWSKLSLLVRVSMIFNLSAMFLFIVLYGQSDCLPRPIQLK